MDQPDFGMLFADMAVGDGEPVALSRLVQPKVEAEVAVIGRDLTHERHTYADLICATEYVLPAIEIVDSRIENWNIRFVDTVADNASSGLFVLGRTATHVGRGRSDGLRDGRRTAMRWCRVATVAPAWAAR